MLRGGRAGGGRAERRRRRGLRLHLSSSSSTGYKGVRKESLWPLPGAAQGGRKEVYLGSFDTAVEAAVAYARAVGEYQPPLLRQWRRRRRACACTSRAAAAPATRACASSLWPLRGAGKCGRKDVYLGTFDTAVEAAVAYARAVGEAQPAGAAGGALAAWWGGLAGGGGRGRERRSCTRGQSRGGGAEAEAAAAEAEQPSTCPHAPVGSRSIVYSLVCGVASWRQASSATSSSADRAAAARAAAAPEAGRRRSAAGVGALGTAVRARWLASKPKKARRKLMA